MFFRYSDIVKILSFAFSPGDAQPAFEARIKHLKKPEVGCVPGTGLGGRGVPVYYNRSNLRHLFLALFLNNTIGLDPKVIGGIYRDNSFKVDKWFGEGEAKLLAGDMDKFYLGDMAWQKGGHKPFYVLFRVNNNFGNTESPFICEAEGSGFLTEELTQNPNGILMDFTSLAAWLNMAIQKWEKQLESQAGEPSHG